MKLSICYYILLLLLFVYSCEQSKPIKPNIVWITSEDNSVHYMKLFDQNGIETPAIASLAKEGLVFTSAFSNAPVCSAARSTIISGCYGPRTAAHYHRKFEMVPMPDQLKMFPAYLRAVGYHTTNNKKEDYNYFKGDDVWDESSGKASWRTREDNQPFFHVRNFTTTHEGRLHFNEEKYKTEKTVTDSETVHVLPEHPNTPLFKYTNALYRDRIALMDNQVESVVNELKEDGLYENTIIFYFGDHGGVLPGSKGYLHETGLHVPLVVYAPEKYKDLLPFKKGEQVDAVVSFVDFAPTVLNLAGVDIPEEYDGNAFLGANITAKELESRDETYSYADRFDEKYDMVRSLRKGKYKYVRNYQPFNYDGLYNQYRYRMLAYREWKDMYEAGELDAVQAAFFENRPAEQLFDLKADPYETNNLADDKELSDVLIGLRKSLNQHEKQMPDLSFFPESYLIENAFDNPVQFGQENKLRISELVDVANLSLVEFSQAKKSLEEALKSEDPWKRYWGLIVCSSFGEKAQKLVSLAKEIGQSDPEALNRTRAAEFLAISSAVNPVKTMTEALYASKTEMEAALILNSMVLMADIHYNFTFQVKEEKLTDGFIENRYVRDRILYLNSFMD